MAVTPTPAFPQTPIIGTVNLAAVSACTTRGPTATASLAAANITQMLGTSTNGQRIDGIKVKGISTSITAPTAGNVLGIWIWDGTTAYLYDEIVITAVTPSTTAASFETTYMFERPLMLPAAYRLYASLTVATTASTTALVAHALGAAL